MKIGLDIMGGDFAPGEIIEGAIDTLVHLSGEDKIVLIGDQHAVGSKLKESTADLSRIEIVHASQVIGMGDIPSKVYPQKPDSSIAVGYRLLNEGRIDGFCSAGNTGAMLVGASYSVNVIPGVLRPALATIMPLFDKRNAVILDVGLNPDTKPDVLLQYGLLGSFFAKYVLKTANPVVKLLNIGEEESKGTLAIKAAYELMKGHPGINFQGNFEANEMFTENNPDVLVCDGFVGNIVLKQTEAFYRLYRQRNMDDPYFERLNFENIGGTPIVGINANVVIGHGISKRKAIMNMILQTLAVVRVNLSQKIKESI